jgi:hypothetical protein
MLYYQIGKDLAKITTEQRTARVIDAINSVPFPHRLTNRADNLAHGAHLAFQNFLRCSGNGKEISVNESATDVISLCGKYHAETKAK